MTQQLSQPPSQPSPNVAVPKSPFSKSSSSKDVSPKGISPKGISPKGISPKGTVKYMLAGGSVLVSLGLMMDFRILSSPSPQQEVCQQVVRADATLSRATLSKLIAVPERSPQAAARQVLNQPYCTMSPIQVRAGITAQREAYPLDFDSQTWLVVLYEGGEYAGYAFSFRH